MEYARVDGDTIIERREIEAMPPHKAYLWRPVEYEGGGDLSSIIIEANRVRIVRSSPEPEIVPPPTKEQLKVAAATKRWRVETGGITVSGAAIDTSRESQGKLTAAWAKAKADNTFTISNWKTSSGAFVTLDNATIIALCDAVLAHVQACFDAEAVVSAEIDAETITTTAQVEAASWPSNQ